MVICALAVANFGCSKDATFTEVSPPLAAIHWVNAVPDTGQQDIRVVDIVSNAGLFDVDFRGSNMFYQPIEAGTRTVRIFMSSVTNQQVASTVIQESNLALTAGSNYTVIHAGFARTGGTPARAVLVIPDNSPQPATGQIALRVINAGAGVAGGSVDVWFVRHPVVPTSPIDSLPDARSVAAVAYGTASTYASVPMDVAVTDSVRIVVTAAGTKTPILATIKAPAGLAAQTAPPADAIAGSRVSGSVVTAVIVPASVAGSQAPQGGAFATPSALYLVDRRPLTAVP